MSDIAPEGWLNELDEHIVDAPFEALMEACFASDEGFMDDDIFSSDWSEDPFEDSDPLDVPSSDFLDPFADGDEEEDDEPTNLFRSIKAQEDEGEAVCPGCSATWNQIVIDERAGCPKCYTVFRVSLTALLDQVQRESTHVGKTPRAAQKRRLRLEHLRQRRDNQLQLLRNRLAEAVKSERYEEAATLRDKIKVVSSSLF